MLTILLVISALSVVAWLLFGRADEGGNHVSGAAMPGDAASADLFAAVPGAPHAVDPGAIVDLARLATGIGATGALTQIDAFFVGSNGTVDLDNPYYKGQIVYHFEGRKDAPAPLPRPQGLPLGAPGAGPVPVAMYLSRTVTLTKTGFEIVERNEWPVNQPTALAHEDLTRCTFRQIWDAARAGDAPADAVATVKYVGNDNHPSWWFQIENTSFGFSFNPATCTRY